MEWLEKAHTNPDTCNPDPTLYSGDILNIDNWLDPDSPDPVKSWGPDSAEPWSSGTQDQDPPTVIPE
jgi:hypothetical protein